MAMTDQRVETAPQLGLATTRELYRELIARALVDAATEGDDAEHDPVVLNLRELLAGVEAQGKASYRTFVNMQRHINTKHPEYEP